MLNKPLKYFLSIIIILVLIYSGLMLIIDTLYSLLSFSPNKLIEFYLFEHVIPNICGIISIIYCIKKMIDLLIVPKRKTKYDIYTKSK